MAIDAGGIQIPVVLTAACRTPVTNLGIRTRPPIRSLEHGIVLELLYTEDASETELTVKSGSVDVGLGIDVMRVLRAYAKGDPLIGANTGPAVSVLDSLDRRSRPILVSTERNRSMSHALKLATLIPRTEAPGSKGQVQPVVGSTTYDITVADLANVACLSIFHFTRTFAATMGVPPHRYVSRRRLESAKTMIATGRASLSEIASIASFPRNRASPARFGGPRA
jgi:AraC-like DNA-binding protein